MQLCDVLDIPLNEEALRAVEGNQHAGQSDGMEEDVSEEVGFTCSMLCFTRCHA